MLGTKFSIFEFIRERKNGLWRHFLRIPNGQRRIAMFLSENGNCMKKRTLIESLVEVGYGTKQSCYMAVKRAISAHVLVEDESEFVSVANPTSYKIVNECFFDTWRLIVIPALILCIMFISINQTLAVWLGIASLSIVVLWFIENYLNTLSTS